MDAGTHATMATVQVAANGGGHRRGAATSEPQAALYDRATRDGDAVICLRVCVDHPERIARRSGPAAAAEVVPALAELAERLAEPRRVSAELLPGELCLLVFAEPSSADELARGLIDGARSLSVPSRPAPLRVSISIGMAHNRRHGPPSWNTVLGVAEEGLEVARSAGGGRHVHTELYELYQPDCTPEKGVSLTADRARKSVARKLGSRATAETREAGSNGAAAPSRGAEPPAALPAVQAHGPFAHADAAEAPAADRGSDAPAPAQPPMPSAGPPAGPPPGPPAAERVAGVSSGSPRASETKNVEALRAELEELYETKYRQLYDQKMSGHSQQVDVLQRRIAKLTQILGTTEDELRRVARMKSIDGGVSSLYRAVQGLSLEDDHYETKRELMTTIFEANLRLRGRELQQS